LLLLDTGMATETFVKIPGDPAGPKVSTFNIQASHVKYYVAVMSEESLKTILEAKKVVAAIKIEEAAKVRAQSLLAEAIAKKATAGARCAEVQEEVNCLQTKRFSYYYYIFCH
jgi:hypothetical protein